MRNNLQFKLDIFPSDYINILTYGFSYVDITTDGHKYDRTIGT